MTTKEIVTLQLGNYANFIGTHWWNIQEASFKYKDDDLGEEEVNHDILFREGQTNRGEVTFTPRLVLAELKGGLGSLKSSSVLYDKGDSQAIEDPICWDGVTTVHKEQPEMRNEFLLDLNDTTNQNCPAASSGKLPTTKTAREYALDSAVKVWSDYLRPHLHPKSMVIINEYNHLSENDPFDLWNKGTSLRACEELEERIRFYAEECDFMQGFHILSDMHTGFAGLTSSVVRYLRDEFSAKQLVMFPSYPAHFPNDSKIKRMKRQLTQSLCLSSLSEHSSLICPVSLWAADPGRTSHLMYDPSSSYHTSAILAATLDTATMKYRLKNNAGVHLQQCCDCSTSMGRSLTSMGFSMPLPLTEGPSTTDVGAFYNLHDLLHGHLDSDPWDPLSQNSIGSAENAKATAVECYAQCSTVRGIPDTYLINKCDKRNSFIPCKTADGMLKHYLDTRFYGSHNTAYAVKEPISTAVPFPQVFDDNVGVNGFLKPKKWVPNVFLSPWAQFPPHPALQNGCETPNQTCKTAHNGDVPSTSEDGVRNSGTTLYPKGDTVVSVPVMTNIQCSSRSSGFLKSAAACLHQGRKRHFSFHLMETDNMEDEIEHLRTLHDEYKSSANKEFSDSDGDL